MTTASSRILKVYVPKEGSYLHAVLVPGSAVVGGDAAAPGQLWVDYEGNRYGAENLQTYQQKLDHAADRHLTNYPTVARQAVPPEWVLEVGTWDHDNKLLTVSDPQALEAWRDA